MNHIEFGLFTIFAFSVFISGIGIYKWLNGNSEAFLNKGILIGEALLLGSIWIVGEFMILSLAHLYHGTLLWLMVLTNFLFLLWKKTREGLTELKRGMRFNIPVTGFLALVLIFLFRNCYFMVDIDSHTSYLFAQKLWLEHHTSIFAERGLNASTFVPHFDAVPYSLGIALFGQDTLFAALVNWFWRFILLILVFGYTSYRFNGYTALAAVMLVEFNEHVFYSGINQYAVLNGVLAALILAAAYNFWEARTGGSSFRFLLALVFLSQLMANKYQMLYVTIFLFLIGCLIQGDVLKKMKLILRMRHWLWGLCVAAFFTLTWYIKNFLATGVPTFPICAGKFQVLGWTAQMDYVFLHKFRGLTPAEFLKYASYFFIWPGVKSAQVAGLALLFLPFIFIGSFVRKSFEERSFLELSFWLAVSFLVLMGTCLTSHQDPRYFRFGIGVNTLAAIFAIYYFLKNCLKFKNEFLIATVVLIFSATGGKLIFQWKGSFNRPTFSDNLDVIFNRKHMDYAIKRHYPKNLMAQEVFNANTEQALKAAWNDDGRHGLSAFLLPRLPQVGLWSTSVVGWKSYEQEDLIIKDLRDYGLEWILDGNGETIAFLSLEEYAQKAVLYDRAPKEIAFPYDMPEEITRTKL